MTIQRDPGLLDVTFNLRLTNELTEGYCRPVHFRHPDKPEFSSTDRPIGCPDRAVDRGAGVNQNVLEETRSPNLTESHG